METYKAIILLRVKTHSVNQNGDCIPPAIEDTGNVMLEIKASTKNELKQKKDQLIEKVKEWISQQN